MSSATCPICNEIPDAATRNCVSCGHDLGCPNVRAACSPQEVKALRERHERASSLAAERGLGSEFALLRDHIKTDSRVVVAIRPLQARHLLGDPKHLYTNYEQLVGAGARVAAPFDQDTERRAVGGKLFGSYADEIRYGVLSLDGKGIANYGGVFMRLREVSVRTRVSFLEENSFVFCKGFAVDATSQLPRGSRCDWDSRCDLASAKLWPDLKPGSKPAEWARQLVFNGQTREDDRFIEAHIYGPFNASAIEDIEFAGPGKSREERNDIGCVRELWKKRASGVCMR